MSIQHHRTNNSHTTNKNNNNNNNNMCKTKEKRNEEETLNDFQKQLLQEHNKRRLEHGVPPLIWDQDIARQTQQWTDKMAKEGKLQHSSSDERHSLGENIANNSSKTLYALHRIPINSNL